MSGCSGAANHAQDQDHVNIFCILNEKLPSKQNHKNANLHGALEPSMMTNVNNYYVMWAN